VRPSFIPPQAIRDLRDLTRRRRLLIGDASSERNRVQKVLEEANVRLGSVLSDLFGVSGQLMLEKLLEGEPNLEAIADLAQRKARLRIPEIVRSLEGNRMREHHRRMLRRSLDHLAFLENQIGGIDSEVREVIEREGYQTAFELLQSIPGIQELSAAALLAETGGDMKTFPSEGQLSSWIGVCPGNRESAGKNSSGRISRGNRWARTALVECAWAASAKKKLPSQRTVPQTPRERTKTGPDRRRSRFGHPDPSDSVLGSPLPGAQPAGAGRAQTSAPHPPLRAPTRQTRHRRALTAPRIGHALPILRRDNNRSCLNEETTRPSSTPGDYFRKNPGREKIDFAERT
jgi:hypothetical protein